MLICNYIVFRIDGDYAHLKMTDEEGVVVSEELKLVALALLPNGINEGTRLHYECMEYSILG